MLSLSVLSLLCSFDMLCGYGLRHHYCMLERLAMNLGFISSWPWFNSVVSMYKHNHGYLGSIHKLTGVELYRLKLCKSKG